MGMGMYASAPAEAGGAFAGAPRTHTGRRAEMWGRELARMRAGGEGGVEGRSPTDAEGTAPEGHRRGLQSPTTRAR